MPLDYFYLGDVKNVETRNCLDTMGRRTGENVGISYCHGLGGNQVSVITTFCLNNFILKNITHLRITHAFWYMILTYIPKTKQYINFYVTSKFVVSR